jgi:hypothetical protein
MHLLSAPSYSFNLERPLDPLLFLVTVSYPANNLAGLISPNDTKPPFSLFESIQRLSANYEFLLKYLYVFISWRYLRSVDLGFAETPNKKFGDQQDYHLPL